MARSSEGNDRSITRTSNVANRRGSTSRSNAASRMSLSAGDQRDPRAADSCCGRMLPAGTGIEPSSKPSTIRWQCRSNESGELSKPKNTRESAARPQPCRCDSPPLECACTYIGLELTTSNQTASRAWKYRLRLIRHLSSFLIVDRNRCKGKLYRPRPMSSRIHERKEHLYDGNPSITSD